MGGATSVVDVATSVVGAVTSGESKPIACYSDTDAKKFITNAHDTINYLNQLKTYKSQLQERYNIVKERLKLNLDQKDKLNKDISILIAKRETINKQIEHYKSNIKNKPVIEGFFNSNITEIEGFNLDNQPNQYNLDNLDNLDDLYESNNNLINKSYIYGNVIQGDENFNMYDQLDLSKYNYNIPMNYIGSTKLMRYEWFDNGQSGQSTSQTIGQPDNSHNEGNVDYNKIIGPVPSINDIGCLHVNRANEIVAYLQSYIDGINLLKTETDKLVKDITTDSDSMVKVSKEIDILNNNIHELTLVIQTLTTTLNNYKARAVKLEQLKNTMNKNKCCVKDKSLSIINTDDSNNAFIVPIIPEEYCGEYWDKGSACDTYYKTFCATNQDNDDCACYSKTIHPTDNPTIALIKSNPRCYSNLCDNTKYLDSAIMLDAQCTEATACYEDIPDYIKHKNINLVNCNPFYKSKLFLIFLIIIISIFVWNYNKFDGSNQPVNKVIL